MKLITTNALCEVFELKPGKNRLYCEELSEDREQEIIDVGIGEVVSRCTASRDGALKIDYDPIDHDLFMEYFLFNRKNYGN